MSELKTQKNNTSVLDFLHTIEDEKKQADAFELLRIFEETTGQPGVMWGGSIIGFGESSYTRVDGSEHSWMLVGFSPRKTSLTLYIMTGFEEYADASGYDPEPILDTLGPHKTGKSCLYIKQLSDINTAALKELINASLAAQQKDV